MEMFYIVLLVFFGLLFLVAELVLLPGVSIGAVLALVCYGSSVYLAFRDFGPVTGAVVIEAKSQGAYVDQQRDVEVVGFENFSVIVKTIK